ncbi:MAG: AzlD domain-containing protein [Acidobacteriota bacterium]|nr:AzlD domain-containing protein [Acidobacteriota bacterium]
MSLWGWILLASLVAFVTKLEGYLVPRSVLESENVQRISRAMTIGLLAALVATQAFASGQSLSLDARALSLVAAGLALWLRAPFLLVVVVGAATAALGRLAGLP